MIKVELVYILENQKIFHETYSLDHEMNIENLLHKINFYTDFPEARNLKVGIFGKEVSLDTIMKDGDRIEFYRPLLIDPKEKRRKKALKNK